MGAAVLHLTAVRVLPALVLLLGLASSPPCALAGISGDMGLGVGKADAKPFAGGFTLTCWQHGAKILERKNLADPKEYIVAGQRPISFTTRSKNALPVELFVLGDALCMVQGEP
ncbi:MAG: hypothetical protein HQL63_05000 [Magnetococcales bacterium]|nr:hypothetical protein [Magnetococcales bacterium]MBF0322254.1 hypothetical protein [Magnetococcales bacterium]